MNEQNNIPRLQMNRELKSVTADITLEPDARREAYRLSNRLAQKTIEDEPKRRLADALGYTDVAPMLAGIEALTAMVIPVQRAFGDNKVACIKREDEDADTSQQSNSAWLEQEREKWRRFELTATDRAQIDELNAVLAKSCLTRRELAVIVASLRLRPGFTLDDFRRPYHMSADRELNAAKESEVNLMENSSCPEKGEQSAIVFSPNGASGLLERGDAKKSPGGRSLFDLTATLRIDADDYFRKLEEIGAETDALIEKTERLVALTREVGHKTANGE